MPINHEDTHTIVDDAEAAARGEFVPSWWNKNHDITDSEGNVLTVDYLSQPLNILDITNYGAVGDGSTDDTDAIVDAIEVHPYIFVPPSANEYMCNLEILDPSSVMIIGASSYDSVLKAYDSSGHCQLVPIRLLYLHRHRKQCQAVPDICDGTAYYVIQMTAAA